MSWVAILSGSPSDDEMVDACQAVLEQFEITCERRVLSAHRQPQALKDYIADAESRGCALYIAMAGMAAHLPGVVGSLTGKPVLGVPLPGGVLDGVDALLSVVQMPAGVPVGALAVGVAGARNAAHLAARILALGDPDLASRIDAFRQHLADGGR